MVCCIIGHRDVFITIDFEKKYTAGKASYIERNYAMIDASDICLFYYNNNYKPATRKHRKNDLFGYQPNSGTQLAYKYATKKNKLIYNVYK